MKTIYFSTALLLISIQLSGQKIDFSQDWLYQIENPKSERQILKSENLIDKYKSFDFSSLMLPKTEFLGFIGNDYQRIYMNFISANKDPNHLLYRVSGSSLVLNNKCDFNGIIEIKQIREYRILHLGVDNKLKDQGIKAQGALIGKYSFKENKNQPHSGEFVGVMTLYWYIDKNGTLLYDDIRIYSDEYRNNQYVGIWKDYSTNDVKTCNWGEYRIPFSGDLDYGAAEFSPRKKYHDKGWGKR